MTELTFTKSFLSSLDSRPIKLQPDHITNPKTLELHFPYTLPRMPNTMRKPSELPPPPSTSATPPSDATRTAAAAAASSTDPNSVTVLLKSTRNPPLDLRLTETDASTTSILELKEKVQEELKLDGVGKIKVLWERKPCSDAKTVREVVGGEVGLRKAREKGEVEFMVMVMGYVPPPVAATDVKETDKMDVDAQGGKEKETGKDALVGEEFWVDLKGFLLQRLKDEGTAVEVLETFRKAWKGR